MTIALSVLCLVASAVLVLLVLLHKGTGTGLSDLFGGSSSVAGSASASRNLSLFTVAVAMVWGTCVLALAILGS